MHYVHGKRFMQKSKEKGVKQTKNISAWFSSWHNSENTADLSNILDQEHQDPPKKQRQKHKQYNKKGQPITYYAVIL